MPQALCQLLGRSRGEKGNLKSALDQGRALEAALSNDESDGGESDGGDDCETQPLKWRTLVETVNEKVATLARGKRERFVLSAPRLRDAVMLIKTGWPTDGEGE